MKTYKDLKAWQCNQDNVYWFYKFAKENFDQFLLHTLGKQLFRSLTSVGANIAEGSAHYGGKEFPRYLQISLSSAIESDYWLTTLAGLMPHKQHVVEEILEHNVETVKMLKGLLKSLSPH